MQTPSFDVIEIENQYYVRAQSSLADHQTNVLMKGDLFAVFDRRGDFRTLSSTEQGLFYKEMRHLSRLVLRFEADAPLLLSSSVRLDNAVFTAHLTNPQLRLSDHRDLLRGKLHFSRSSSLWGNTCSQRILVQNYDAETVAFGLILELESDFADIFEVRGFQRKQRGNLLDPRFEANALTLRYQGLDGIQRWTCIESSILPAVVSASQMRIPVQLPAGAQIELAINIHCHAGEETDISPKGGSILNLLGKRGAEISGVDIYTSNEQFNNWISRSAADLKMLVTPTP